MTRTRAVETSPARSLMMMVVATALWLCPGLAAAQAPVRSFDQLDTRLKIGDTVWVTDAEGRQVKGKVRGVGSTVLTLDGRDGGAFTSADVRVVALKRHENLAGGTLVGLGVGLGVGAILAASLGCNGERCLLDVGMFGGMGAGIGCGIDALIPENRHDVIYRAPAAPAGGRFSIRPVMTPRTRGITVSFGF